ACRFRPSAARTFAAACASVGLCCNAICSSSSRLIDGWSAGAICARSGAVITNKSANPTDATRFWLFTVVLHLRHHRHWFLPLLLAKLFNLVVLVRRKHADECHHSTHESAPAGPKAEGFWFLHHLVHGHHWPFHVCVLGEPRHCVCILAYVGGGHFHSWR